MMEDIVVVHYDWCIENNVPTVYYRNLDDGILAQADSINGAPQLEDVLDSARGGQPGQAPRVRQHFPETWIWDLVDAGYEKYQFKEGNFCFIKMLNNFN